jgi:hypothetical protein
MVLNSGDALHKSRQAYLLECLLLTSQTSSIDYTAAAAATPLSLCSACV